MSVQNLLALHEAKYGPREGAASTAGKSFFADIADTLIKRNELKREMEYKIGLLQAQKDMETKLAIEKEQRNQENSKRMLEQFQRTIGNLDAFQSSGDDRTMAGDVKRVASGDKAIIGHRKYRLIPKGGMKIKDGVATTELSLDIEDPVEADKRASTESKQMFDMAGKLRDDLRKSTVFKDFQEVRRAGGIITSAYDRSIDPNTKDKLAADQALVTAFNKMLDPGSVVRESEYARTPEGQAIIQRAIGVVQQFMKGGTALTEQGRTEIKLMAEDLLNKAGASAKQEAEIYGRMADKFGIDRDLLFSDEEFDFDSIPASGGSKNSQVDVRIDSVTPNINEGTVIRNPSTGERKVWKAGQWQTM